MLPFRSRFSLRLAYLWELHLMLCIKCPFEDVEWLLQQLCVQGLRFLTGRCRYSCRYRSSLACFMCLGSRFTVPALWDKTLMLCIICPVWRFQGMQMGVDYACGWCWDRMDRLKQGHVAVGAFGALDFLLTRWCPGHLSGFSLRCAT
jgi:hypothetical protein